MARKLGELLLLKQHISEGELDVAIQEQSSRSVRLGELLLEKGVVSKHDLVKAIEELTRTTYVDCAACSAELSALERISKPVALRNCALPLRIVGSVIEVVMAEPQDLIAHKELEFAAGFQVKTFFGFRSEIEHAIEREYKSDRSPEITAVATEEEIELVGVGSSAHQAAIQEFQAELRGQKTEAVQRVTRILSEALKRKASDIHIEQRLDDAIVRIRVDGILQVLEYVPGDIRPQLVSRIKILGDLNIAERRVPQDGRFLAQLRGRSYDIRVSTLPTQYGEKIAIRILDPKAANVTFEQLGFRQRDSEELKRLLRLPQGMVLVTGPTGSGKSTTLYSALSLIRASTINITTIEDPIEYAVEGANQVQVNPKAGRTFSSCLRSLLRQDPNVIMVGEIRDAETAEMALTAAQTGHLVLSTLHTNDSVSAISRLIDLDIPPFLIASSVSAILAQRLVRKLCKCRKQMEITDAQAGRLRALGCTTLPDALFSPGGCAECDNSGYRGRLGVYELLVLNDDISQAIATDFRDNVVRELATAGGTKPLMSDALEKVVRGVTTLDEVLRVVPQATRPSTPCANCGAPLSSGFLFCPTCGKSSASSGVSQGAQNGTAKRAVRRYSAYSDLRLTYEGFSTEVSIRVPDISAQGMFINTVRQFPEGAILKVSFHLPKSGVNIQTRAEVRYCLKDVGVGLEFIGLDEPSKEAIEREMLARAHDVDTAFRHLSSRRQEQT
jgi:type IV pilus assembly protein PilB